MVQKCSCHNISVKCYKTVGYWLQRTKNCGVFSQPFSISQVSCSHSRLGILEQFMDTDVQWWWESKKDFSFSLILEIGWTQTGQLIFTFHPTRNIIRQKGRTCKVLAYHLPTPPSEQYWPRCQISSGRTFDTWERWKWNLGKEEKSLLGAYSRFF